MNEWRNQFSSDNSPRRTVRKLFPFLHEEKKINPPSQHAKSRTTQKQVHQEENWSEQLTGKLISLEVTVCSLWHLPKCLQSSLYTPSDYSSAFIIALSHCRLRCIGPLKRVKWEQRIRTLLETKPVPYGQHTALLIWSCLILKRSLRNGY